MSSNQRGVRLNLVFCLFMSLANVFAIINACETLWKPDGQTAKNWLSLVFFVLMFVFFAYSTYKDYRFIKKK